MYFSMALTDVYAEIEEVKEYLSDYYDAEDINEHAFQELNQALDRLAYRLERVVV